MTMEQARGRTGAGNGGKTGRKTVRGKDPETVAQEQFEAWMQRIMERFDRQDKIISVLINKDAAGVKYMDGERPAASTGCATGKSAARATTRSRTCWSSSAGTWRRLCRTARRC